jgi:hypothetical protein
MRAHKKNEDSDGPKLLSKEIEIEQTDALESEIQSFVQKVRDRTTPLVSGQNGKRALEVALAITGQIKRNTARRRDPDFLDV